MSRNGKIARLPRGVRERLNHRLEDGEPGPQVLAWLNDNYGVREVLKRDFGGRPVSEQNLSEWRQGGFRDWQRQQEAREHVGRLADQSEALDEAADGASVSDRLAQVLAAELFKVLEQLLEKSADDKEKFNYLRKAFRELRALRRGDHNAARLRMESERWERQQEREDEEYSKKLKDEGKSKLIGLLTSPMHEAVVAQAWGGGERGQKVAEMITKIKYDLPWDDVLAVKKTSTSPNNPTDQAESDQIKPNQTANGQIHLKPAA